MATIQKFGITNADGSFTVFVPEAGLIEANAFIDRLTADCYQYIAERDEAVAQHDADAALIAELQTKVEQAEACCGCDHGGHHVLPTPDMGDPLHLRWVAKAMRNTVPRVVGLPDCQQLGILADWYMAEADRLERERSESAEREQRIEKAITAYFEAAHGAVPRTVYEHVRKGMAAALDAAGMLTGGDA